MSRTVAVVPHSHWDREWYAPFESYQARLVIMMEQLMDLLEADARFGHFHLDGQVALVDDFLAVRPQEIPRLAGLVSAGRLAVGPWYVLMDEFCVSGETIVRNLELGMARAAALGGGPAVGYLPDMFGHISQMPQILRHAGISHAVVWRGVPAAVTARAFWWEAPDGSRVRAEYLPVGYAAGAFLPKDPAALIRRVEAHETEIASFIGADGPLLLMNGGDHQSPQAWLPDLLAAANGVQDRLVFEQTSLARFLAGAPVDELPVWPGELRSGARAPILMGVLSTRVDVKQAAAEVENLLERMAEPLAALWLPPDLWPGRTLERAWLEVIRNSAHDSICACSADPVVRAVRARYDSAAALGGEVVSEVMAIAGVATARPGTVIVNPLPRARGGLVELDLPGTEAPPGTQQLQAEPAATVRRTGTGGELARILGELAGEGWLGDSGRGVGACVDHGADGRAGLRIILHGDRTRPPEPAMAAVMAEAWALAGAGREQPLTVQVHRAAAQRVVARVDDVPGWGWTMWPPAAPGAARQPVATRASGGTVVVDNGLTVVAIDPASGTFAHDGIAGQNLLVEEGDEGDTYNFSADPGRPAASTPTSVEVDVREGGPVRAVVRVSRWYPWGGPVVSDIEVGAGDATVRVTTSLDHHGRDHRIRAWFPLGATASATVAECAFATVRRAEAEGGPGEAALATFPSRRFVTAGPLTVTHQGLLEHELVDGGSALAVTLLRATGLISRPAPPARPNVAGPPIPLRDSQMPGPQCFRYALARNCRDPWDLADRTWTPLLTSRAEGVGRLADRGARLTVTGGRVSALRRQGGMLEVRVFNPSDRAVTVAIPGHRGRLVDLAGRPVRSWAESFPLAPWALATARLDAVTLDDG